MANIETTVNELVINQLSKTKYEELKAAGTLQENQLYMVDEDTETSTGISSIDGVTGEILLGNNLHIENNILSATNTVTTLNGVGGTITLGDGLSMDGTTLKVSSTGGSVSGDYLPLSGGTLTGPLTVQGDKEGGITVENDMYSTTLVVNKLIFTNKDEGRTIEREIDDGTNGSVLASTEYVNVAAEDILKQKFVVSSTEPENPQENMIWIQISE